MSQKLTFRITPVALIGAIALLGCVTPVAWALPGLQVVYLVPVLVGAWIMRVRTTVTPEELIVRTVTRTRHINWDQLSSLRVRERGWVKAVLASGEQVSLPAVHTRDLELLTKASGGRVPSATSAEPSEDPSASAQDEERDRSGTTGEQQTN